LLILAVSTKIIRPSAVNEVTLEYQWHVGLAEFGGSGIWRVPRSCIRHDIIKIRHGRSRWNLPKSIVVKLVQPAFIDFRGIEAISEQPDGPDFECHPCE